LPAIKGIEKFAPRDFPGCISATVFTGGCNFRCPYCHNADLVLRPESLPTVPQPVFLEFLDSRKGFLEAVCISGGEPLLHDDLEELLQAARERGLQTKLDTNGSFPSRLQRLLDKGLVDCVAMDVKAPLAKYPAVAGFSGDTEAIRKSTEILKNSGVRHLFRTTAVPDLIDTDDIEAIGRLLEGSEEFRLQQFVPRNTLDPAFLKKETCPREKLEELAKIAGNYFSRVVIEDA
jgi:pyruvate formate lyase activating enzyme